MFKKIKAWFLNRNRVISMTTVEAIKSGKGTLIDVREPHELELDGFVPNAINIPLGDVPHRVDEIKGMEYPIIVFCRSGQRSANAAMFLQSQGLEDVYNGGGFQDVLDVLEA
ncbi:rhodanese-like domain-containing protein [Faecalibacter sp. LW9]|uniref:rhodanese-like domain-containing protein n=1 Tax=Faecalibacter sp. LW9 TaxID=3103144 RepID=UPI002B0003E4